MARYPSSRCPSCGSLSHMCACGTMQHPSQLPLRIQARMAGNQPRDFMQPNGQPQSTFMQPPQPVQQQFNVDQVMAHPQVQQRINGIVENALANYNPPAPDAGIDPELIAQLAHLSNEEIPSDPPLSNAGGRRNAYNKGREEAVKYVKEVATLILESASTTGAPSHDEGFAAGKRTAQVGFEGVNAGDGQVSDILCQGNPAGG